MPRGSRARSDGLKYYHIPVKPETYKRLTILKKKLSGSWDNVIDKLLEYYENFRRLEVKQVMCNHFRESRASLKAWATILLRHLEPDQIPEALSYLIPLDPNTYIINQQKCSEKHGES